jgi:hypothetical protein
LKSLPFKEKDPAAKEEKDPAKVVKRAAEHASSV